MYKYSKDNLNPTVAFAYKPIDNLSIYTSYAESYTKPVEVSNSYINAGEIFEPIKNKQKEIESLFKKRILPSFKRFTLEDIKPLDIVNLLEKQKKEICNDRIKRIKNIIIRIR